ncbi:MAG: hypothetical protein IAE87_09445 [Rhodobacteraceae bacterium]|nr:hypothetical protein [Paracoccaceae bacterium]
MDILGIVGSLASILSLAIQTTQMCFEWVVVRLGKHQRRAKFDYKVTYNNGGTKAKIEISIDKETEAELIDEIGSLRELGVLRDEVALQPLQLKAGKTRSVEKLKRPRTEIPKIEPSPAFTSRRAHV